MGSDLIKSSKKQNQKKQSAACFLYEVSIYYTQHKMWPVGHSVPAGCKIALHGNTCTTAEQANSENVLGKAYGSS